MKTADANLNRSTPISNPVLGMILLLITETMFFAGLISSYIVNKADVVEWPPVDQPRLPIYLTVFSTVVLLSSAVTISLFLKKYHNKQQSKIWLIGSIILGSLFILIQGYEWVQMIGYGITSSSSMYGAFFYTIIGFHGFHVLIGIVLLYVLWYSITNRTFEQVSERTISFSMYWYFVVAIWPILYYMIYLV